MSFKFWSTNWWCACILVLLYGAISLTFWFLEFLPLFWFLDAGYRDAYWLFICCCWLIYCYSPAFLPAVCVLSMVNPFRPSSLLWILAYCGCCALVLLCETGLGLFMISGSLLLVGLFNYFCYWLCSLLLFIFKSLLYYNSKFNNFTIFLQT